MDSNKVEAVSKRSQVYILIKQSEKEWEDYVFSDKSSLYLFYEQN